MGRGMNYRNVEDLFLSVLRFISSYSYWIRRKLFRLIRL